MGICFPSSSPRSHMWTCDMNGQRKVSELILAQQSEKKHLVCSWNTREPGKDSRVRLPRPGFTSASSDYCRPQHCFDGRTTARWRASEPYVHAGVKGGLLVCGGFSCEWSALKPSLITALQNWPSLEGWHVFKLLWFRSACGCRETLGELTGGGGFLGWVRLQKEKTLPVPCVRQREGLSWWGTASAVASVRKALGKIMTGEQANARRRGGYEQVTCRYKAAFYSKGRHNLTTH